MKKLSILALILMCVLTSCSNLDNVTPDDNSTTSTSSSSNTGVNISLSLVAQTAKDFVAANYAGYIITEAEKQTEDLGIQYKLTIEKGSTKKRLLFDTNWKFSREKN